VEQYVERLERAADREKVAGGTLVVDFSGGVASLVASRVFSRLGINAVVMEGFANANVVGGRPAPDLEESLDRVSRIVPMVEAAFGCVVGATGEDVRFVDDRGEPVPPDVMLACLLERMRPQKAVLPINLSTGYRELVESHGGTLVQSRTGLGNTALKGAETGADIAGTGEGHYIFPAFLPAPDCFMTLARALELFRETPLSETRRQFGESFGNVARERLECPWSAKGRVMRGLAERFGGDPDAILTDGVKLSVNGGWVLMLPDPDNPLFYVYAETEPGQDPGNGAKEGRPEELLREYADLVRTLIRSEE
jgi:mannose-1-phosphate guanylyltransferase/phosphomannomutase